VLRHGVAIAVRPGPRRRLAATFGLAAIVLIAGHVIVSSLLTVWLQPYVPVETYTFAVALRGNVQNQLPVDVFVYAMMLAMGYAIAVYDRARVAQLRESQLEADLAHAQLNALRLEIEPHFLFNTLNAIASLIRSRSTDRALDMLLGLSALMRATLDRPAEHTRTVDAELAFVQQYVELQRVRFMDRLDVCYQVAPDAGRCAIPTLIVQPLVENAFRHGIARRPGHCRLEVGARLEGPRLHLWVHDNGAGLPDGFSIDSHSGVGLRNTASRLRRFYGDEASFRIQPAAGGGTEAHIELPAHAAPEQRLQAAG
jgi:LytS/YehU family sensor histidine kinase